MRRPCCRRRPRTSSSTGSFDVLARRHEHGAVGTHELDVASRLAELGRRARYFSPPRSVNTPIGWREISQREPRAPRRPARAAALARRRTRARTRRRPTAQRRAAARDGDARAEAHVRPRGARSPTPRTVWINRERAAVFGLAPQIADVDVERVRRRAEVVAPDPLEDDRARQHLPRVARKSSSNANSVRVSSIAASSAAHLARTEIELQIGEAQHVGTSRRRSPPAEAAREDARGARRARTASGGSRPLPRRAPRRDCRPRRGR